MLIDLSKMLDGTVDTVAVHLDFPAGFVSDMPGIDFDTPFTLEGKITDSAGYMRLEASASVPYGTVCARCLKPLRRSCEITVDKTVAVKESLENADAGEIEDQYILIENGNVSLDDAVGEQLYMNMPWKILCREDCRGLCQYCGQDLNEKQCSCEEEHKKTVNPSFAKLGELFKDGSPDQKDEK